MNVSFSTRVGRIAAAAAVAFALSLPALPAAAQATVPANTAINTVLDTQDINTKNAQAGDGFTMDVVSPYPAGDDSFAGARIRGHVAEVIAGGQGRSARLRLAFDSIVFADGRSVPIQAAVASTQAKNENTTTRRGLGALVGAAIGSQTIGRIIGGSAGSVVGLLGGAAGGFLYAKNDKPNFNIAKGTAIVIDTTQPLEVPRRQAGQ
jgi:outer membrane lipoprotein SlyB